MGRACPVCAHPQAAEVNEALVAGEPMARVLTRFDGLSARTLRAHMKFHLVMATGAESPAFVALTQTKTRIERTLADIEAGKADPATVKQHASFLRELRQVTEKLGHMRGDIQSKTVSAMLGRLGVRSESELLDIVEERRELMNVTVDDLFRDCLRGLKDCFAMKPEFREVAAAELFPPQNEPLEMEGE